MKELVHRLLSLPIKKVCIFHLYGAIYHLVALRFEEENRESNRERLLEKKS